MNKKTAGILFFITRALLSVALLPSTAHATPEHPIVVSMGDSYASGEGIEDFYGQHDQNKYANQDFLAHRSERSWSGQLVVYGVRLNDVRAIPSSEAVMDGGVLQYSYTAWEDNSPDGSWFFVAASGAKTRHILGGGYVRPDEDAINASDNGRQRKICATESVGENRGRGGGMSHYVGVYAALAPQIEVFDYIDQKYGEGAVDYVTISIGGNDLGFADIVKTAAIESSWITPNLLSEEIAKAEEEYETDVREAIRDTLVAVRDAAGPQAKIIIVGYPMLFNGAGYGSDNKSYVRYPDLVIQHRLAGDSNVYLSPREMLEIDMAARWLDYQLSILVESLGGEDAGFYYVPVFREFANHGAYAEKEEWINRIIVPQQSEDLPLTGPASSYSVHPNADGARAYAAAVQQVIDRNGDADAPTTASTIASSNENRAALIAYQTFLQGLLDKCDTVHNGYPAISTRSAGPDWSYMQYTSICSFAIGYFGDDEVPGLLVCWEDDTDVAAYPSYEICLYMYHLDEELARLVGSWDVGTPQGSFLLREAPSNGMQIVYSFRAPAHRISHPAGAQFYADPNSAGVVGGLGIEVELFFDHSSDYDFSSSTRYWLIHYPLASEQHDDNLLIVESLGDGAYSAWTLGEYALEPLSARTSDSFYERDYLIPGETTFYSFSQESVSSIV